MLGKLASASLLLAGAGSSAGAALVAGDLSVIGFHADSPDGFAIVAWVPVPAGTQLSFTDNSFNGTSFAATENSSTWTVPSGGLSAGQVVWATNSSGQVFDVGGSATGVLSGLSNDGDQIFVFEGTGTSGTPITAVNFANAGWLTSGSSSSNNSYLPSTFSSSAMHLGNFDNGQYTGSRVFVSVAAAKAAVADLANWTRSDTAINSGTLDSTDFVVPEPATLGLLGLASLVGLRRRSR